MSRDNAVKIIKDLINVFFEFVVSFTNFKIIVEFFSFFTALYFEFLYVCNVKLTKNNKE